MSVRIREAVLAALAAVMLLLPAAAGAESGRVTLLHINDIYEIVPVDDIGGFAPLMTLLRAERQEHPQAITTLGGDFLSPSLLSGMTQGRHMVELLDALGVEVTVFGNHEFDFGPDVARARIAGSRFVWLGTNVLNADGSPFGGARSEWIRTAGPFKIGFFGVLTPTTAAVSSPGPDVRFTDPQAEAAAAVGRLRARGAQVVVALTHLGMDADRALAQAVKGIDVILGGHDHEPMSVYENGVLIFKAGHDGQFLGVVELQVDTREGQPARVAPVSWLTRTTTGVTPDPEMATLVKGYTDRLASDLDVVIGTAGVELDTRGEALRSREAPMANYIADIMRRSLEADVALLNGGAIRGGRLMAPGTAITRRDVRTELPFDNQVVLLELTGADLLAALEHGLSKVDERAGRFPQVSGLSLVYDPLAPAGRRVVEVRVGDRPLDPASRYRVATVAYLLRGGDGYAPLARGTVLIDPSGARLLTPMVMDHIAAHPTVAPQVEGRIVSRK
jgi:2',3'-cyclic-nucleotide 2'-phosphodiesterase (5'-nucleotidase family)